MNRYRIEGSFATKEPVELGGDDFAKLVADDAIAVIERKTCLIVNEIEIYDVSAGDSTGHLVYTYTKEDT